MGLFNTYSTIKHGNQKITPNFLKHLGFKKCRNWGSPRYWGPGNVFWSKTLVVRKNNGEICHHSATLLYFPPEFDGYGTQGVSKNRFIGWMNGGYGDDLTGDACCKMDIYYAIDNLTNKLIDNEE